MIRIAKALFGFGAFIVALGACFVAGVLLTVAYPFLPKKVLDRIK